MASSPRNSPAHPSHPGFQAVAKSIAAKGSYNMKQASAILAASTRNASVAAKKNNPNLKKVK